MKLLFFVLILPDFHFWLKAFKFLLFVFLYKVALKVKIIMDCWWDDSDRETSNFFEKTQSQCVYIFVYILFLN